MWYVILGVCKNYRYIYILKCKKMDKRPTIKCSLCDSYFIEGREYREHWEKEHLQEYLKLINYKDL